MDETYAQIGGYNIKIIFKKIYDQEPGLVYYRKKVALDTQLYLGQFNLLSKPKKFDFEIEICDLVDPTLLNTKDQIYSPLFQKISDKKFITYYQNNISQLEMVVKHALLILTEKHGGFGIHASCANVNGRAYLFLGKSGAGKSTSVELLKDKYPTISDDMTLLKKIGQKYYVFNTPFLEKSWWIKKSHDLYQIDKIFFIHKSAEFKMNSKPKNNQLTTGLFKQVEAAQNPDKNILKNVNEFIKSTNNFYDLYFAKDSKNLIELISHIK